MKIITKGILLIILVMSTLTAYSSHIVGASIQYECLGGNDYRIYLNVFRNCNELTPLAPTTLVGITRDCNTFLSNNTLALQDIEEVSQLCGEELAFSSCNEGGTLPGVQVYKYEGIITIGSEPGEYRVSWNGQGFRSETNNLVYTGNETQNVYASIFKESEDYCNNSAVLTDLQTPYFCLNQDVDFNFSVLDPDQDNLTFSLAPAQQNAGFCSADLPYQAGFSSNEPIPGISINPITGQISFDGTSESGSYTIVVQIDEHRDGELVGRSFIDVHFILILCPDPPPVGLSTGVSNFSGTAMLNSPFEIEMCSGESFCFDYTFESPIDDAILEVTSNMTALFPSAELTTTGTNPITATVCYTAEYGDTGGIMVLNVNDDNCPTSGISSSAVLVHVNPALDAGMDQSICADGNVQFQVEGDTLVNWEVISGEEIILGTNFSCNNCPNPIVSPSITTTYLATGLNLATNCINTDTVTVSVGLDADIFSQPETCASEDGFITIEMLLGSGDYSLEINDVPIIFDGFYDLQHIDDGTFEITITDNASNCMLDTVITLDPYSTPIAYAGEDVTSCGLSFELEAVPSSGYGVWSGPLGLATFSSLFDPNAIVTVTDFGSYEFTWTENNGQDCGSSDVVEITFIDAPTIDAGIDDEICGLNYELNGVGTADGGAWEPVSGITFEDISNPTTMITGDTAGEYTLVWTEDNGFGCELSDEVVILLKEIPTPDAGTSESVCGLTKILNATPSVGLGLWTGNSDLTFADENDPHTDVSTTSEGEFDIVWTENNQNCILSDTIEISFVQMPTANAGVDLEQCGVSVDLGAIPSFGEGTWSNTDPETIFEDETNPESEVTVPNFGIQTFTWTEDNGDGCVSTDEMVVNFLDSPIANAGENDSICGLESITLHAVPSTGEGEWSFPGNINVSDINDPDATFTSSTFGEFEIVWTESDAICSTEDEVTIGFYEQPFANAGADFNVCGLNGNLFAIPSNGEGLWSGVDTTFLDEISNPTSFISVDEFGAYTLSWTETNGICSSTDDVIVNFVSNGLPDAGEDESTCSSTYFMNATPVTDGTWIAQDLVDAGILDPSELNNPFAPLNFLPGGYGSFELTWYDPTCAEGDVVEITYLETPTPFAGSDIDNCGLSVDMNATDNLWDGVWILPSGLSTDNPTSPNATIEANIAGEYQLIWQESNDICSDTNTVLVNFINIPEPNVGADDFVCGLDYTLNVNEDGVNGSWDSSGPLSYMPDAFSAITNVTAGDYGTQQIFWSESDPTGTCIGSDTLEIIFNNPPDTANFNIECLNLNTQFQISFDVVGGDTATYVVSGPGTLSSDYFFESIIFDTHDNYNFALNDALNCDQLFISDQFSCPSLTDAGTLEMDTLFICHSELVEGITNDPVFEDANDVSLYVIHTSSDTTLGSVLAENYDVAEFIYIPAMTNGVVYYLSSVAGDSLPNGDIDISDPNLEVSFGVPVIFSPDPTLSLNDEEVQACTDQDAVVDFVLNGAPTWDLTYTFNENITTLTDIGEVNNSEVFVESGWVYFNNISNQFCSIALDDSIQVTINENPVALMDDLYQFCANQNYLVDITLSGEAPWNILFQAENLLTPPLDTTVTENDIQLPVAGEGYFWIANLSDNNCPSAEGIDSTFVEIVPTPVSLAGEDVTVCFGQSAILGETNEPGLTYSWTHPEWLDNPFADMPEINIDIDTTVTEIYPMVLTTSNGSCDVLDTVNVTILPLPYDITLDPVLPFCIGDDVMLGVSGPYDFSWFPTDGLSDPTINNPITSITEDFNYYVIAEDSYGCVDSVLFPVMVLERPEVLIEPSVDGGCLPLEVEIYNNSSLNNGSSCLWTFSDDDTFISDECDNIQLTFDELGSYSISLRVIAPNGCIGETILDSAVTASFIDPAFFYTPEAPRIDFSNIQFIDQSQGAINWDWIINDNIALSGPNPTIDIETLGAGIHEACLQVINEDGCIGDLCKTFEIKDEPLVWVPNAFTPNNNNVNEVFIPIINGRELVESYEFSVFNRIGRRIFNTTDMDLAWGSNLIEERKRQVGTYVWMVELKIIDVKDPVIYKGTVTLFN